MSRWSEEDNETLLDMFADGQSFTEIAEELGRTEKGCKRHWERLQGSDRLRGLVLKSNMFLDLLRKHHDYNMKLPEGHVAVKAEPEPIIVEPVVEEAPTTPATALRVWLDKFEPLPGPSYPTVSSIKRRVAEHFGITVLDLESMRRHVTVAFARQVAMYLCRALTPRSYPDIASKFGGRDPSTAMHAVKKIERLVKEDWQVAYDVAHIEAALS